MANLKSLREKVKNITDYSPELQQFNDQLDELINDAFYALWTRKRWTFTTKSLEYRLYPDITPTRDNSLVFGGGPVEATVVNGNRQVLFSAVLERMASYPDVWQGQPITIQDYEYTISKVLSSNAVLLDEPFRGEGKADDTSWLIKKRYYDLPEDCLELLYFGYRDYPYNNNPGTQTPFGKANALLPRRDEDYDLRADLARDYAEAYIPQPSYNLPPGEQLTLEEAVAIGDFPFGKFFEFCWCFYKDGKWGALSEPQTIQITDDGAVGVKLNFLGWDDQPIFADGYVSQDQIPSQWEGYKKKIFWNKNFDQTTGERKGLPCWLEVVNGGTRADKSYLLPVEVPDTLSFYIIQNYNQLDNGSKRYIEVDGQWQQIRPYPRPDGWDFEQPRIPDEQSFDLFKHAVIRYVKKPKDILLNTDSPEMPYEFHQLVVYKALEDIYLKLGQQGLAATYEKKYMQEIRGLEKRYVDKIDFDARRQSFTGDSYPYRGYNGTSLRRLN